MSLFRVAARACSSSQWTRGISASAVLGRADSISNATKHKEAPIVNLDEAVADPKLMKQQQLNDLISVPAEKDLSPISGVPTEHIVSRRVRIYIPPKNAMQSGTNNIQNWEMQMDNRERWENPLMGWTSSGDPLSNITLQFNTKEEAIVHCEKNGWKWYIDGEEKPLIKRNKNYGVNFAWNKRTRVSTK